MTRTAPVMRLYDGPKVIQVIEADTLRGNGVHGDPTRRVRQYYTLDGELLAESDPETERHQCPKAD